jgi:hypothetical protein
MCFPGPHMCPQGTDRWPRRPGWESRSRCGGTRVWEAAFIRILSFITPYTLSHTIRSMAHPFVKLGETSLHSLCPNLGLCKGKKSFPIVGSHYTDEETEVQMVPVPLSEPSWLGGPLAQHGPYMERSWTWVSCPCWNSQQPGCQSV